MARLRTYWLRHGRNFSRISRERAENFPFLWIGHLARRFSEKSGRRLPGSLMDASGPISGSPPAWGGKQYARAVGMALGANPVPIIVPCHRIIAHDGSLGGFSCGLPVKRRLLKLEGTMAQLRHAQ